jgi:hypothetical protein
VIERVVDTPEKVRHISLAARGAAVLVRIRHARGVVSEYLEHAGNGVRAYVIRAQPSGMPKGVGSLSIWVELLVHLQRLVARDRSWTVCVRRHADDPFGAVAHEETASDEMQARARVAELKQRIESGRFFPWAPEVGNTP